MHYFQRHKLYYILHYIVVFPSHSLSKNAETLKSTFNLYSLTPPPSSSDKDCLSHLRATNDNDADFLLEQPETKQDVVQRKCFTGGN